jgi:hypothetical protein
MRIDRTQQITQLQTEIAGLEQAINALAALPQEQQRLQDQLAEKRRQLAALQSNAAPPSVTQAQSGGVNFGVGGTFGDVTIGDVVGGDKISGDKVMGNKLINYGAPRPADLSKEHLQSLIAQHTRRLRALEIQAAQTGFNARPEVIVEMEDIRSEISRLSMLLEQG